MGNLFLLSVPSDAMGASLLSLNTEMFQCEMSNFVRERSHIYKAETWHGLGSRICMMHLFDAREGQRLDRTQGEPVFHPVHPMVTCTYYSLQLSNSF